MPMSSKRMEFDTIIVDYNYRTGAFTIQVKGDGENNQPVAVIHGEPEQLGAVVLNSRGIGELREALEGIGQQLPGTRPRPR